jgi:hypothetical protein
MASVQLSFALRTSSSVKTVHLLGSWDNYNGQLPLSKDKSSSKSGWKGTFKFQGATLIPGQRYWYYYIIDGYHVSHDPGHPSTTEPTTGRVLNILDVPHEKSSSKHSSSKTSSAKHSSDRSKHSSRDKHSSRRDSRRESQLTVDIPKGRPLSVSQIKSPKPVTPHATRFILETDYGAPSVEELTARFAASALTEEYYDLAGSPPSSVGSSLSSRSDSSSPSSASSLSDYSSQRSSSTGCTCQRYGITRKGDRVKLDCGGSRCGYSDESSSCCSSGGEEEYVHSSSRRHGVVVRR